MSEIKLLPCPFCGGEKTKIEMKKSAKRYYGNGSLLENYTATMRCNICHARGSTVSGWVRSRKFVPEDEWLKDEISIEELHESAIKAWNTRKPMERIVERLQDELELSGKEKERAKKDNPLQFDRVVGYSDGIAVAIDIVREAGGVDAK